MKNPWPFLYHLINLGQGKVFMVFSKEAADGELRKSVADFLRSIRERRISEEYVLDDLDVGAVGEYVRLSRNGPSTPGIIFQYL